MHDVITIGSATVDLFLKSSQFHLQPAEAGVLLCQEYGGKLDIEDFFMQSGGAGTNTAVGFRRMGFQTAAVAEIGKDLFAQVVWDDLKRENVDTQFIVAEKAEQTAFSALLISGDGGRSALTHRGAASMLEPRDVPWEALRQTRWIHLSNCGGNVELLSQIFEHLKSSLVGLSWNPGSKELQLLAEGKLQVSEVQCDILIVNAEEWQVLEPVQAEVLKQIQQIVVTDGKKGGQLYLKGQYQHHFDSIQVPVVQETGAGDAFCVGFVSAHLMGQTPVVACEWGIKNSAGVIQHMGAKTGLLTRKDFDFAHLVSQSV